MKISGPSTAAAALENSRTRAASSADTATPTFKKADPRLQQPSESVSVTLSSIDKFKIVPPAVGAPTIFAASPDTPINASPDVPRAALSPLTQSTDQSSPRQLGGDGNRDSSTGSLGNRNGKLENRPAEEQARVATQQAINAQTENSNSRANTAIAAYQRIFSL